MIICIKMCIIDIRIAWDDNKRRTNLKKHGLDFTSAAQVFSGPMVVIAHTESEDGIRVISMRKGTPNEQKIFFENL